MSLKSEHCMLVLEHFFQVRSSLQVSISHVCNCTYCICIVHPRCMFLCPRRTPPPPQLPPQPPPRTRSSPRPALLFDVIDVPYFIESSVVHLLIVLSLCQLSCCSCKRSSSSDIPGDHSRRSCCHHCSCRRGRGARRGSQMSVAMMLEWFDCHK